MGKRRPRGRNINGMLVLDKPIGVTSNSILQDVRRIFGAAKAGHTGSLDPLASGMLPICFGEATKVCSFLLDSDKRYLMRAKFGERTDSADADGEVVEERDTAAIDKAQIEAVLEQFRGDILQVPPMYSALHHEGRRLYELAREGIEVEREARPVTIHDLELTGFERNEEGLFVDFEVRCSKGTYVRTIAEDIAGAVDNVAHIVMLRRIGVAGYTQDQMVTLDQIKAAAADDFSTLMALLGPVEEAISHWPLIELDPVMSGYIRKGNPVMVPQAPRDGLVRLRETDPERFIGVGEINEEGLVAPRRMIRCA